MSLPRVIVTNHPATEGAPSSPREQLSNQIARISQMQRKTVQVCIDVMYYPHVRVQLSLKIFGSLLRSLVS